MMTRLLKILRTWIFLLTLTGLERAAPAQEPSGNPATPSEEASVPRRRPTTSSPEERVIREADRTVYKKKTVIDFSDVTIQGALTKPEGSYLLNRKKTNFKSLLKARANFIPELQTSIDNL